MILNTTKWAAVVAVAAGFAFMSAAVLGRQEPRPEPEAKKVDAKPVAPPATPAPHQPDEPKKEETPIGPVPEKSRRKTIMPDGRIIERDDSGADDIRSRRILAKLEEPISMSFANETPLDDVLKYIKQATTTPTFSGIPIYVDPVGLQEAERSLNSTIQVDLEDVPLKTTLRLILKQLGMAYFVEDGYLLITSEDAAEKRMPPALRKKVEQAKRGELTASEMRELIEVFKLRKELLRMAAEAPSESKDDPTAELLNEVRQLIQILRAEKEGKKIPGGAGLQ